MLLEELVIKQVDAVGPFLFATISLGLVGNPTAI